MHRRERCGKNCGKLRKIADINPGRSTRGIFFLVGGPRDPLEGSRGGEVQTVPCCIYQSNAGHWTTGPP